MQKAEADMLKLLNKKQTTKSKETLFLTMLHAPSQKENSYKDHFLTRYWIALSSKCLQL